jgi:hypothetical protein
MRVSSKNQLAPVLQLKVSLKHSDPKIWRRLLVKGDTKLNQLHQIIQHAMGWWNSHLHQFEFRGVCFGEIDPDLGFGPDEFTDESKVTIGALLSKPKEKLVYEYDFGDGWDHEVLLEKVLEPLEGQSYPVCTGGARNCPPEDCGGIGGYEVFLDIIYDPEHPEHHEMLDWIGGSFDPEAFDLAAINSQLQAFWPRARSKARTGTRGK